MIILDNGDRLTGEIKKLRFGALFLSLDYVDGTIQVQWSRVVHVESHQLFHVRTEDGQIYTSALNTIDRRAGKCIRNPGCRR